ncbi:MAG: head-tail connector protein [Bacteroidales bacterium]|nr:head-tail connector protein [Bacteroidales bacterium]
MATCEAELLVLLKKHVRADDFDADDALLQHYMRTAKDTVIDMSNRTAEEISAGGWDRLLDQAVLMLAAHWYNQREAAAATQVTEVPFAVATLVKRFTKLA